MLGFSQYIKCSLQLIVSNSLGDALPRDSNVRRSREVTEKGSDVRAIVDCGCGVIANGKLA